jgi:hypothetical protein
MKLKYDGEAIGSVTTNHSMTIDECLYLLNIDLNETEDENTPKYDYELFEMDYND